MPFHLTSAILTGNPSNDVWTQVHDFTPQDEEKLLKRGRLVVLITFEALDEKIAYFAAAKEILLRLHEEYYPTELNTVDALRSSLGKVHSEFSQDGVELQIAACVFIDNTVYL